MRKSKVEIKIENRKIEKKKRGPSIKSAGLEEGLYRLTLFCQIKFYIKLHKLNI